MAASAQSVARDGAVPAPGGTSKKLLLAVAAVLILLVVGGGLTAWFVQKKHADEQAALDEEDNEDGAAQVQSQKKAHKAAPVFLPLEPFIVNLADTDSERFTQIGITLELDDAAFAEQVKTYMPAIRNGVLMVIAHKSSKELLTREGKEQLASEIMREVLLPLDIELKEPKGEEDRKHGKSQRKKIPIEQSPVRHVHFSSFIIQ
jgi:flagellar FliL protein